MFNLFDCFSGFILSFIEYRRSNRIKKSSYLEPLIDKMMSDKDIADTIYMLQYSKFKYTEDFHNSEQERKLDKTLQYYSYLCYLKDKSIISSEEFSFFELEISQALRDQNLIDYLYNLFHFSCKVEGYNHSKNDMKQTVYGHLLSYALSKGLINDSFYDNTSYRSGKYPKYLNF